MPPGLPIPSVPGGRADDPILGALRELTKSLNEVGKLLAGSVKSGGGLPSAGSSIGPSPAGVLGGVGAALGKVGLIATAAVGGIVGLGAALGGLVSKATPAVFEQFSLALNDLMAVIGRTLVPLFQTVFIPLVRTLADAFLELTPIFHGIITAIQPVVKVLIELLGEVLAGALQVLGSVVQTVAPYVLAFARVITEAIRTIMNWARQLLAMVGVDVPGLKPGASTGAAVRSASHMDPLEAVKAAQRAAFSLGTASSDPMLTATKGIYEKADEIYKWLKEELFTWLQGLPDALAALLRGGVGGFAESTRTAIDKAVDWYDRTAPDIGGKSVIGPVVDFIGESAFARLIRGE